MATTIMTDRPPLLGEHYRPGAPMLDLAVDPYFGLYVCTEGGAHAVHVARDTHGQVRAMWPVETADATGATP